MAVREITGRKVSLLATVALSVGPDIDFAPGIASGQSNRYHGSVTHSLTAAVVAGGFTAALGSSNRSRLGVAAASTAVYGSHLLLDAFGKELADGMPLLWPFNTKRLAVPGKSFRTIYRRKDTPFLRSLLNRGNRRALIREIRILLPVYLLATALTHQAHRLAKKGNHPRSPRGRAGALRAA